MTILSARYANTDNTAVVIETSDAGAVVISERDTPGQWVDWQAWDETGETSPYIAATPVKTLRRIGVVRFTVAANVVTTTSDSIGIGAVTRISAGRYRAFFENADPDLSLLPGVCVRDAADVRARVSSRTATFLEVRTVNASNAAVDVAEVIITFDKVIST